MDDFRQLLAGAVIMAPMTKGSNLPYRRLCSQLGATITMSEMAVARRLRQRKRGEFALIQRAPDERCFGVQLAGRDAGEMAWAAALAESRGADLVDVNLGCPIDEFTRRGLGAALLRRPKRIREIVEAMKKAVARVPVTVKIRLGWSDDDLNYVEVARAAVDGGADAVAVHGRTRRQRYRKAADWEAIGTVTTAVAVPVIGNGDILYPHDIDNKRGLAGCAGVMVARGALIKPWVFREARDGLVDESAEFRWRIYSEYARLGIEHWGDDDHGRIRFREFLVWHLGFWCRFVPRRPDGSFSSMQERESLIEPASPAEALLARLDSASHAYLADCLLEGVDLDHAVRYAPSVSNLPPDPSASATSVIRG
jgi:tRNA-dihydrouridine synthase 3